MRRARAWRWIAVAVAGVVLAVIADYAAYPRWAGIGGQSFNKGENGLWLRYTWYFGEHSDADIRQLASQFRQRQIRYAYFHVRYVTRDGRLRFHYADNARRLVRTFHRLAPSVRVIAWVYAGNTRGEGEVDLTDAHVRSAMMREMVWLFDECGFDGVQWDYEICRSDDKGFLALMRETGKVRPAEKWLGAAVPVWMPPPFQHWGWSEAYIAEIAKTCDQLAVMCYDTGLYLPRAYVWWMRQQSIRVPRAAWLANPQCQVILGVPTYEKGGIGHHARAENLRLALKGVREGLSDERAHTASVAGVALFADYTTDPEEWETYRSLWLEPSLSP